MRRLWLGYALVFCMLFTACNEGPSVTVVNDLDFEVALVRCEDKSIFADETYISPGKSKTVHSAPTCTVQGPTSRAGPFGTAKNNGPYVGCLVIPEGTVRMKVSQATKDLSDKTCDGVE